LSTYKINSKKLTPRLAKNFKKRTKKMDSKSIGMCVATILIKVWADIALSEVGVVVAIIAGISTIVYNVYRMYKEIKG
jgi:predicted Na+-dependent transporter